MDGAMNTRSGKNLARYREALAASDRRLDGGDLVFNAVDTTDVGELHCVVEIGTVDDGATGVLRWDVRDYNGDYDKSLSDRSITVTAEDSGGYVILDGPVLSVDQRAVLERTGRIGIKSAQYVLLRLWDTGVKDGPEYRST